MKTMNNVMGIEMLTEADWMKVRDKIANEWFCACMSDDWHRECEEKDYLRGEWLAAVAIATENGWTVEPLKVLDTVLRFR